MRISRKFNLIGGKVDFQYISSIDYRNDKMLFGYSPKVEQALDLTECQTILVECYFQNGGIEYQSI